CRAPLQRWIRGDAGSGRRSRTAGGREFEARRNRAFASEAACELQLGEGGTPPRGTDGTRRMSEFDEAFDNFKPQTDVAPEEALVVAVDGFEGPLDLLLTLARNQKVDLAKISVLKLADQYLEFIERAKRINLELAADYLVMAAWLAYLKSKLILPQTQVAEGEPTADEMAARLRWRLQRLNAMREAAARLMARDRLGREVFERGDPEPVNVIKLRTYKDTLYDLLTSY